MASDESGLKRKADNTTASSIRKRRARTTAVEVKRIKEWDHASARTITREEIQEGFRRSAVRFEQLDKYGLLYEYKPIKASEIRLLRIKPSADFESDIKVTLVTIADQDTGPGRQEYEALSYHWGKGPADRPIYFAIRRPQRQIAISDIYKLKKAVPDYEAGIRTYVRPNLEKALRHLRHSEDVVVLWVDAMCINQPDEEGEKPAQIAKMTQIYHRASNVCIWLGDGKGDGQEDRSDDFHAAMDFSTDILDPKNLESYSKDPKKTKSWSDLLDLMRCSWFSRRWVIQELALARDATLHCGNKFVHWLDFADAIGIFGLKFDEIRTLFQRNEPQDDRISQNYKYVNQLEPLGAKVLVDAITNAFRKGPDNEKFEPVLTLEALVSNLALFESSDPRDTIFALLNISRESLRPKNKDERTVAPPRPLYKRNLLEVYTDFLEWVVYSEQSIDIICRQWAIPERIKQGGRKNPTPLVKLPSWIQTISKSTWGSQAQGFHGRTNADSLVGKPGRRRYNASYSLKPEIQFGQRRPIPELVETATPMDSQFSEVVQVATPNLMEMMSLPPSQRLRVKGLEIGTIHWTVGPVVKGVIRKECLERAGWKIPDDMESRIDRLPDKLWRTLVADRTAEGDNPPPWYHRAALISMAMVVLSDPNRHFDTREPLDVSADKRPPQIVAEYLKRVQAVTWNRMFIEGAPTTEKSEPLFGLAPPETKEDDRVCILFGCSVPCILRPCKSESGTQYFEFVGEAYIYGRMDGEALSTLGKDELKAQTKVFQIL